MATTDATLTSPRPLAAERVALPVAAGAAFLGLLDTTVANLAVANVRTDFVGASVGATTWMITIYAVVFAALLAPAGRLADVVGRRTLLRAGAATFTLMSLAAALAPSLAALLVARGLQGAAAAAMLPASLAVVIADVPPERRAAAIGAWSAAGALAAAIGPALGGVLVDTLGWRSVFLINVPVGIAIVAGARRLPISRRAPGALPDLAGTVLLGGGVGMLALGISQGPEWGWDSAPTLVAIAGGALGIVVAVARSRHHATPALETSLWRSRTFAAANVTSLLYGAALFPWLLVGVLFLIQIWSYSPLEAGFAMTPGAFIAAIVALRSGPLVARHGPRVVVITGALLLVGAGLLGTFTLPSEPSFLAWWLPVGVLIGLGTGAITTGTSTAAMLSVTPARFAAAGGLNQTARQVGGALGLAVLAAVLTGGADGDIGPYTHVYFFCSAAALGVAIAACWLVLEERRS